MPLNSSVDAITRCHSALRSGTMRSSMPAARVAFQQVAERRHDSGSTASRETQ